MVEEDKNMRLFIGIELSEEIKGAFVKATKYFKKGWSKEISRKENLHLTQFSSESSVDELFYGRILTDTAKQNTSLCLELREWIPLCGISAILFMLKSKNRRICCFYGKRC